MKTIIENKIKELKEQLSFLEEKNKIYTLKFKTDYIEQQIELLQSILDEAAEKETVEETTYRVGTKLIIENNTYIIARVNRDEVILICLADGNKWGDAIEVEDDIHITKKELDEMIGEDFDYKIE